MNIYESAEDYLETILVLCQENGYARSVDIAAHLNVTKPSVSFAMKKLRESGYILMGSDNRITLTESGEEIAIRILDRHRTLTQFFMQLGVAEEIAREDACKIEHYLSEQSYNAICERLLPITQSQE